MARHVPVLLVPVLLVLASVVAGCTTPSTPGAAPVPDTSEPGPGHVHGVELNPYDSGLYAATHDGVFGLDAESPVRVSQHRHDTMSFAAVGPDHFLASGHPAVGEPGPAHLGLTAGRDGGRTWGSVALAGRADFHALSASGATVYGFDGVTTGAPTVVSDLDVDPDNPMRVITATRAGLTESLDGGITFTALAAQPPRKLALIDHVSYVGGSDRRPALIGLDVAGTVFSFEADGWQTYGSLPGPPTAFTVIAPDHYAAASGSQVLVSDDAGRTGVLLARLDGS